MGNSTFFKVAIGISIILNFILLTTYHSWGDDFAMYLLQARALVYGGYHDLLVTNTDMMDHGKLGPYLYPIGYPILLSPIYFFDKNPAFITIKVYNLVLFFTGIYFVGKTFIELRFDKKLSRLTIVSILFSSIFVFLNNEIFSDIPSFTVSFISVYCFLKYLNTSRGLYLFLLFLSTAFLLCIRTTNIIFPLSYLVALVYKNITEKNHLKKYIGIYSVTLLSIISIYTINIWLPINRGSNEMHEMMHTNIFTTIADNTGYYLGLLADTWGLTIASLVKGLLSAIRIHTSPDTHHTIATIIVIFLMVLLTWMQRRNITIPRRLPKETTIPLLTVASTLLIYLIWPHHQSHRFIIYVYPFLIYGVYKLISFSSKPTNRILYITSFLLIAINSLNPLKYLLIKEPTIFASFPGTKNFNEMMAYINNNVPQSAIIGIEKPRILYYETTRKGYVLKAENYPFFDYLLITDETSTAPKHAKLVKTTGILRLYKTL